MSGLSIDTIHVRLVQKSHDSWCNSDHVDPDQACVELLDGEVDSNPKLRSVLGSSSRYLFRYDDDVAIEGYFGGQLSSGFEGKTLGKILGKIIKPEKEMKVNEALA